jgi:hypothetical protein
VIECPNCEKNFWGKSCPDCGYSLEGPRTKATGKGLPVWTPPTYPEPQPGDDALIRVQRERLRDLFRAPARRQASTGEPVSVRSLLPPIDPAIRAEIERREQLAATRSDRTPPPDLAEADDEVPDW